MLAKKSVLTREKIKRNMLNKKVVLTKEKIKTLCLTKKLFLKKLLSIKFFIKFFTYRD